MTFTTTNKMHNESLSVDLSYSMAKCILVSLKNRLKGENVKQHFANLLYRIDDAKYYAYWHCENEAKEIFLARDYYIDYVLSFRK